MIAVALVLLLAAAALTGFSVLAFRAAERAEAYRPVPIYNRRTASHLDRDGHTRHGMVDARRHELRAQRRKTDSYYESHF